MAGKRKIQKITDDLSPADFGDMNKAGLEKLVGIMLKAKPKVKLNKKFKARLKKQLFSGDNQKMNIVPFFTPKRIMLAASIFSVLLIVVFMPTFLLQPKMKQAPAEAVKSEEEPLSSSNAAPAPLYKSAPVEKKPLPDDSEKSEQDLSLMSVTGSKEGKGLSSGEILDMSFDDNKDKQNEPGKASAAQTGEVLPSHFGSAKSDIDTLDGLLEEDEEISRSKKMAFAAPETEDYADTFSPRASAPAAELAADSGPLVSEDKKMYQAVASDIKNGVYPAQEQINIPNLVNSFSPEYENLFGNNILSIYSEFAPAPWNPDRVLMLLNVRSLNGIWKSAAIDFNSEKISSYRLIDSKSETSAARQLLINKTDYSSDTDSLTIIAELTPAKDTVSFLSDNALIFSGRFVYSDSSDKSGHYILEQKIHGICKTLDKSSDNFLFSSAVVLWAAVLKNSGFTADTDLAEASALLKLIKDRNNPELADFSAVIEATLGLLEKE